jgi:hypothetical protein
MKGYNRYIYIIFVLFVALTIYDSCSSKRDYYEKKRIITRTDFIDSTFITSDKEDKTIIVLNDSLLVPVRSKLIGNRDNFKNWETSKPIISFSNKEYELSLRDVPYPYFIYKDINSDTIIAIKDTFELKFKIDKFRKENL